MPSGVHNGHRSRKGNVGFYFKAPINPRPPQSEPRTSWWAGAPREGFTGAARKQKFLDTPESQKLLKGD